MQREEAQMQLNTAKLYSSSDRGSRPHLSIYSSVCVAMRRCSPTTVYSFFYATARASSVWRRPPS